MKFFNRQSGVYCLNKGWKFIEKDISVLPPTINHDDVYGYSKGGAAKGPADAGFEDSSWEDVILPHDWVTTKEFTEMGSPNFGYKERGVGWYRIRFELPKEDMDKQILLEFEGMSCDAQIYMNGMILKHNFSGYNSFAVDITDMVNFGVTPNTLAVRIDASAWEGWWYEGAGIYRNVWLVKKPAVHTTYNGVFTKPVYQSDGIWNLEISVELENSFELEKDFILNCEVFDKGGEAVGFFRETGCMDGYQKRIITGVIEVKNPRIWSHTEPNLYQVKTSVTCDNQEDFVITDMGFRTIRLDALNGFWLNGENIKLKGFCNHQDHAGVGVAVPYAVKEYRMKKLKELGANAYRCAHNPDPEILTICDRIGLLVMEENRTFNSSDENLKEIKGIAKTARNHPCVVLYSVLNEEPLQGTGKGRRMAGRLMAAIKEVDDTRPVLGAFNGGYMEEDGAATILDAVGINYNPGRYDEFHQKYPDIPLIGSETASAFMVRDEYETNLECHIIDNYDEECAPWGTTVRDMWKYVNERPFVAGTFVWTGFDYRGEPTPFTWPSVGTFFGTYDSCGFEKDACYFYKAFWNDEPMVHLVSPWKKQLNEGENVKVMVITNCEEVEVYVGNERIGKKRADLYEQVLFDVPYEKGRALFALGYKNGAAAAKDSQISSEQGSAFLYQLSKDEMFADGHDAIVIDIFSVDKNGNRDLDADQEVMMDVTGGAYIAGVGNGDPNSHEPDLAKSRRFFHGCCQMILKNCKEQDVMVKLFAAGYENTEIFIPVKKTEFIPYIEPVDERVIDGWGIYYKLFDEMPGSKFHVERNDMNSFEPAEFTGVPQPQLSGQYGKYGVYRTVFTLSSTGSETCLYFGDVKGHVWIYLDQKEVVNRTDSFSGELFVDISNEIAGEHTLLVIILNANQEWPYAGICMPVTLK